MIERATRFLESARHPEGGWGYLAGQQPAVEPTAAVALGLAALPEAARLHEAAVAWLLVARNAGAGWGLTLGDIEGGWQTAWALLALAGSGEHSDAKAEAQTWLSRAEPLSFLVEHPEEEKDRVLGINLRLNGWPWLAGQASWVEPTALAMLALRDWGQAQRRLDEAVSYLLDRRCAGGGWNVGNPVMFDAAMPARAQPTALALLALAHSPSVAVTSSDLKTLRGESQREGTALATALTVLALRALGEDTEPEVASLMAAQAEDGGWDDSPFATGLAVLALSGGVL